jgi:hypothetical protein
MRCSKKYLEAHSIPYTFNVHWVDGFRRYFVAQSDLCCAKASASGASADVRGGEMIERLFGLAFPIYRGIKPVRDAQYLAWVRSFPCIACGTVTRSRDAMHIGPHGMSQKASDIDTLPGCRKCHEELGRLGPVRFQLLYDLDFREAIATLQDLFVKTYGRLPGGLSRAETLGQKGRAA